MLKVNEELLQYDPTMGARPQIIAVNKTDIPEVHERLKDVKKELTAAGVRAHYISASTGEGVNKLMEDTLELLKTVKEPEQPVSDAEIKVFRPKPREDRYDIHREIGDEGTIYVVDAPELDRLYAAAGTSPGELKGQVVFQLQRMGAWKELEKMGIRKGDVLKSAGITWIW
jgi:GTP-binding protein